MILNYPVSDHEAELVKLFGGYENLKRDMNESAVPAEIEAAGSSIVICFSNRSGSNLLADSLKKFGTLRDCGEYFNHDVVTSLCNAQCISTLSGYYAALRAHVVGKSGSPFCTKLSWAQLYFLNRIGFIRKFMPRAKFITTRRRDMLAQAVSFSIASQTKRWTSQQKGEAVQAQFDAADIENRLTGILSSNYYFDQYFAVTGFRHYDLYYEDVEKDFCAEMMRVMQWLEMPVRELPDLALVSLRRQRTAKNREFMSAFRAEWLKSQQSEEIAA